MCITRVGKVLAASGETAKVEFFDRKSHATVDISMVKRARAGAYLEVYGNLALSVLSAAEASRRKAAWREIRKAAMMSDSPGDDLV